MRMASFDAVWGALRSKSARRLHKCLSAIATDERSCSIEELRFIEDAVEMTSSAHFNSIRRIES
jgi:hypothetical protein